MYCFPSTRLVVFAGASLVLCWSLSQTVPRARADEPPALNPFGSVRRDRDDAVPGYLETSDGKVYPGSVYMTRDKRLKILDDSIQRQREVPLRVVQQIECTVLKQWMEREWRFKELALNEKYYTGREYPSREYVHTITLKDGRTITGPLAEIVYVRPYAHSPSEPLAHRPQVKAERFLLHKRDKGDPGEDLKSLTYVKLIKLGEEALEEGRGKAGLSRSPGGKRTSPRGSKSR